MLCGRLKQQAMLMHEKLLHKGVGEEYSNLSRTSGVGVVPEKTLQRHNHKLFKGTRIIHYTKKRFFKITEKNDYSALL